MTLLRQNRRASHCDGQKPELLSGRFPPGLTSLAARWGVAKRFVSSVVLVTDSAIAQAQRRLWADVSVIAEPGGAAALAAIASGAYRPEQDERVGVLVCGANADLAALA